MARLKKKRLGVLHGNLVSRRVDKTMFEITGRVTRGVNEYAVVLRKMALKPFVHASFSRGVTKGSSRIAKVAGPSIDGIDGIRKGSERRKR